jgi:hypothetical protein
MPGAKRGQVALELHGEPAANLAMTQGNNEGTLD